MSTTVGPSHTTRPASELMTRNAVTAAMQADCILIRWATARPPEPRRRSAQPDHVEGGEAGGDPSEHQHGDADGGVVTEAGQADARHFHGRYPDEDGK